MKWSTIALITVWCGVAGGSLLKASGHCDGPFNHKAEESGKNNFISEQTEQELKPFRGNINAKDEIVDILMRDRYISGLRAAISLQDFDLIVSRLTDRAWMVVPAKVAIAHVVDNF